MLSNEVRFLYRRITRLFLTGIETGFQSHDIFQRDASTPTHVMEAEVAIIHSQCDERSCDTENGGGLRRTQALIFHEDSRTLAIR